MAAADITWPSSDSSSHAGALSFVRALLNILEDTASEKEQLHGAQSAVLNILEDTASEKEQLHGAQSAVLNILEDTASEKERLHGAQSAVLNILEDTASEKKQLHEMQSAVLNVLEDFDSEKHHLEDMKKAVVNILDDLGVEKRQLGERTVQLEAANKELEAFAYSVSHDLRAPLRGIDGWSMALLEDYAGRLDVRAQQYLDRLRSETQRMGRLIDELLQLSRVTRVEMQRQPVDLTALARSTADRLSEAHPGRQLEFLIEPGLTGIADAHLLEVALTNLLDNAVKFTGRRSHARIEVGQAKDQGEPAFFVRDNGAGFDMAYAGILFGAFQRLHKATEFPGTGIGLATVQRVIHRHGGRVWAEAQVDAGATFYFTLGALK
jgi:signal transduction histidine kinase